MRKIQPKSIAVSFTNIVLKNVALLSFVEVAANNRLDFFNADGEFDEEDVKTLAAEQCMLFVAVGWENFLTELFICYINRDCSVYQQYLQNRVNQAIVEKLGHELSQEVKFVPTGHLTKSQIKTSLDPANYNLTFKDAADLKDKAARFLAADHAKIFKSLTEQECAVLNAWLAIRNYLGHRSAGSWEKMKISLSSHHLDKRMRWTAYAKRDLGKYLMVTVTNDGEHVPRMIVFLHGLISLCTALTPNIKKSP